MLKRLSPREWNGAEQRKKKKQNSSTKNVRVPLVMSSFDLAQPKMVFFYAKLDIREGSFPTAVHSQPALAFVGIWSPSESIVKAKWTRRVDNITPTVTLRKYTSYGTSKRGSLAAAEKLWRDKNLLPFFFGGGLRFKRDCREISPTSPLDCRTKYLKHGEHRRRQAHTPRTVLSFPRQTSATLNHLHDSKKLSQPAPISQKASSKARRSNLPQ